MLVKHPSHTISEAKAAEMREWALAAPDESSRAGRLEMIDFMLSDKTVLPDTRIPSRGYTDIAIADDVMMAVVGAGGDGRGSRAAHVAAKWLLFASVRWKGERIANPVQCAGKVLAAHGIARRRNQAGKAAAVARLAAVERHGDIDLDTCARSVLAAYEAAAA